MRQSGEAHAQDQKSDGVHIYSAVCSLARSLEGGCGRTFHGGMHARNAKARPQVEPRRAFEFSLGRLRQREDRQHTAEVGVLLQIAVGSHHAKTFLVAIEASCKANASPTTDA
jgi:hypothetical protein